MIAWHIGFLIATIAQAPERPAVTARLDRPDEQLRRVIALFDGTTSPHPAAALAQWKRARRGRGTLGKTYEALIAALNPGMADELLAFDGAELQMTFPPDADRPRWNATIPGDTSHLFAAFATAMALTDGGTEPPLESFQVDRLGPKPDGVLMAHDGSRVVLGRDREDLRRGQERLNEPLGDPNPISRIRLSVFPDRFGKPASPAAQRAIEAARGLSLEQIDVQASLEGDTFILESSAQSTRPFAKEESGVDPSWLNLPSSDRAIAMAAIRFDGSPEGLERLFAVVDRVEKTDPARAKVAPARTRLNLLALAAGLRPEVDLWPKLIGISASLIGEGAEPLAAAVVALHAIDDASAERLAADVLPTLARSAGLKGDGQGALGTIAGQALTVQHRGPTVLVIWGTVGDPMNLGSPWQPLPAEDRPSRVLQFLPGRIPGYAAAGSPLAAALDALPPIVWEGTQRDGQMVDRLRITGLKGAVHAFLDRLPRELAPPEYRDVETPNPPK